MIEVNIENLELFISKLSKLIKRYENAFYAINREYDNIKENWQSEKNFVFYKKLEEETIFNKKIVASLKQYLKTMEFIYNRYKEFGDNINIQLDDKERIIESQKEISDSFNKIINICNSSSNKTLSSELRKLKEEYKKFLEAKNGIENFYDEIETIENDIHDAVEKAEEGI